MMSEPRSKVTANHLKRNAFLYVRQSTLHQVMENTESTRRQYDLRQRAVSMGWPTEQVEVIDSDLGQSGASAADRAGFQRLVGEVGSGHAGIVMGLEVSRLARNSSDWHRLLEICALTDTLILDEDGVYDPAHFNDRLLLGLKGTMSEAELHVLRARLQGGYMAKARRGELRIRLPVGFVYDAAGKVQLDPDRQVQDAIRQLFTTFRRLGTLGKATREFEQQGFRFPCRPPHGPRMGELVWQPLTYSRALTILRNPRYTGAFVLGRTRQRKRGNGRRVTRNLARDEWTVLLPDAHPGYITWEEYEGNLRLLHDNNWRTRGTKGTTPPREGTALLQGLVLCGVCGKRMSVRYCQRASRRVPTYYCQRSSVRWAADRCQTFPGAPIDAALGQLIVEEMTPRAVEVALSVQQELRARFEEADRLRRDQVERARYEAEAARRRYMRIDPDNRLVADALEADWNEKLRAHQHALEDYERRRGEDDALLSPEQRERVATLAADFSAVWNAPTTSDLDRKRILRLLVEDVTLRRDDREVSVHVRFRGGATRSLHLPLPMPSWKTWLTPAETVAEVDRLLDQHTDAEVAAILNERGFRSGQGRPFHSKLVHQIRQSYGLKSRYDRLREQGMLTVTEVARRARVSRSTVLRWHHEGRLCAHRCDSKGRSLYDSSAGLPERRSRNVNERSKEVQYEA